MPDTNYGPILIMAIAVLAGALLLGIGVYIRGNAERGSPAFGAILAAVIVAPMVAGIVYYTQGLTRDLTQPSPHLYPSEGSPPAVQSGEVPVARGGVPPSPGASAVAIDLSEPK